MFPVSALLTVSAFFPYFILQSILYIGSGCVMALPASEDSAGRTDATAEASDKQYILTDAADFAGALKWLEEIVQPVDLTNSDGTPTVDFKTGQAGPKSQVGNRDRFQQAVEALQRCSIDT